jgi:hypothetical protein
MSKKSTLADDAIARMAAVLGSVPTTRKQRRAEINARYYKRNEPAWHVYNNIVRPIKRIRTQLSEAYNVATGQPGSVATAKGALLAEVVAYSPGIAKQALDSLEGLAACRGAYAVARGDFWDPGG